MNQAESSAITKIDHRAAWTAKSLLEQSAAWTYTLSDADIEELDHALRQVLARGLKVPHFGKADFPMPGLDARLARFRDELEFGLGVLSIKGLPIARYSKDEASAIFWGIGAYFGRPWPQNGRGHLLGDVINEGKSFEDPNARGYQSTADLEMHTDGADEVALLCLRQAEEGGEFHFVSTVSMFNRLADSNPAALRLLLEREWQFDWRGEEKPGEPPYYCGHIYERIPAGLACFSINPYIRSAQRFPEVPRLSDADLAALDAMKAASQDPELVVRVKQQPGDILFLNNHFHCHGRSQFKDAEDPRERRHLRRLWLESPNWGGTRPRSMQTILEMARSYWESPDSAVQMWDEK
jgi:Taurine catabolism dioxygenase TauD, TfdA family